LGPGSYPVLALTTEAWIRELQQKGLKRVFPKCSDKKGPTRFLGNKMVEKPGRNIYCLEK